MPLCLSLVHHYSLDINAPTLVDGLTIFHCSCLSGSLDLVSSLSPLADLTQVTEHGESALYLSVYAAVHRSRVYKTALNNFATPTVGVVSIFLSLL